MALFAISSVRATYPVCLLVLTQKEPLTCWVFQKGQLGC